MNTSLRKLIPYIIPYKSGLLLATLAGVVVAALSVVLPFVAQIIMEALESKDLIALHPKLAEFLYRFFPANEVNAFASNHFGVIKVLAFGLPIYYFLLGAFRFYNSYRSRYIGERIANDLRYGIMDRLLDLNASYYFGSKTGSGGLLSRTLNDTLVIQNGINTMVDLVREPLTVVALTASMIYLNWRLFLFTVIFAPAFSFLIRRISKSLKSLANQSQETLDQIAKQLKESLDGMRVIQSHNLENHMRYKFQVTIDEYNRFRRKIIKRMEMSSPLNEALTSVMSACIFLFSAYMIFRGQATPGEFIAFIAAAAGLNTPVKKIQQSLVYNQQIYASIDRVFEIIDSQEVVRDVDPSLAVPFPTDWKQIEYRNVSFTYGGAMILKNINLTVRRGSVVALVGESGSGKSTLVNLLERFFDPTEGEVLIDGININRFRLNDLRNEIALVTQDVFLFNETLEENLRAGNKDKTLAQIDEAIDKANATKFVEKLPLKYQTLAGERGSHFSGGEKQRLSIARAILKNAPILILDEATSALDSASEVEVQKGLKTLMSGRTAFVIAHRLSTIAAADRILVMRSGEIVEEGTHSELLSRDGVYAYYQKLQDNR